MGEKGIKRNSNIEMLRIISMLLILVFHCAYKSGFEFELHFSINKFIVKIFWMFGELGVNIFILISGYFMIKGNFKWKKVLLLLSEVMFYQLFTYFIAFQLGIFKVTGWKDIVFMLFPVIMNRYWFITVYIIIYILSPYFNLFIYAMDQIVFKKFLITVLFLYSVIPTLFGLFFNSSETLLYYNRLIWLIIVYFIGAYIRLYDSIIEAMKKSIILSIGSFGALVMSILIIEKFDRLFAALGTTEVAYLWPPNTMPMLILSVGIFGIFLNMKPLYNVTINKIASTTLGIYLLHDGILESWLWKSLLQCANYYTSPFLVFYILGISMVIFLIGMTVDLFRQIFEKYIMAIYLKNIRLREKRRI